MSNRSFKFHWGHGIVLTFIVFAGFMTYFYVNMSRQTIDLVGDHYYEDGQKFQQKLDIIAHTNELKTKVSLELDQTKEIIACKVPGQTKQLKVDFFFPADASKDKHFTFEQPDSLELISTKNLVKGKWKVTISYLKENKPYLQESTIHLD